MPRVRLSSGDHLDVVPWMQEPMHQLVLENQHTRIYRIRFLAGAVHQTLFHLHTEDTVYLCVSDGGDPATGAPGLVYNQVIEGGVLLEPAPFKAQAGTCFCSMHKAKMLMHRIRVSELNRSDLCFIGAELLASPYPAGRQAPQPLHAAQPQLYSLQLESHLFRVYKLTVPAGGGSLPPHQWPFCGAFFVAQDMDGLTFQPQNASSPGAGGSGGDGAAGWLAGHRGLKQLDAAWINGPVGTGPAVNAGGRDFTAFVVEWL